MQRKKPDFNTLTLPCGLRIVHERTASDVVHCGCMVLAGTRHEADADSGMAHFIEHMSFKGTERRPASRIANALERYGGDLNAFTNKQETVYTATVLRADFRRAADVLTDIVFHSLYRDAEIRREVEVICDEIESYHDSPAELIFDEFEALLFEGHALGRDILGDAARLRTYTTADARRFADACYRPDNAVFYVVGNVAFTTVVRTLTALMPAMPPSEPLVLPSAPLSAYRPREAVVRKDTHQAHVLIGARTFGGSDPRRYALSLLNNILGGPGMNSRLNVRLREKSGLVYTVDSSLVTYTDAGWWGVYFGCDPEDVATCRRQVRSELDRLVRTPLSEYQLREAKRQLCGQLRIADAGTESHALAACRAFARYGVRYDLDTVCSRINAVTAADVQALAEWLFDAGNVTTLIYK